MFGSGRLPSVQSKALHTFAKSPSASIPRSTFNRSHGYKTTFDAGYLIPVYCDEALPGDTFDLKMTGFARLATPLFPIMDNVYMETFFFAVPYRLVWDNWEKFNGAQDDPDDPTDFLVPVVDAPTGGWTSGSVGDYFGLPIGFEFEADALHFRAMNLIWNEWFRDENLQTSLPVPKDNGPDDPDIYDLLRRGKRYDYFTSCLPWPQKGPSVELPIGATAPIIGDGNSTTIYNQADTTNLYPMTLGTAATATNPGVLAFGANTTLTAGDFKFGDQVGDIGLVADLEAATAASINVVREAFQIQRMLERDARGGTRYTEVIRSHFGVISPDMRLQRPEYLGGGSTPVIVAPVAQTSSTDVTSPLGNLAAVGTCAMHGHGFLKSFTEHCLILGFVATRADLNYQQGINRMWSRQTRYDFYWPALSHIGEQAVLNKEIYVDGTSADEEVFGYQERFGEYRYKPGLITGLFRSDAAGTLDSWHLAQDFGSRPVLDTDFIKETPPFERIKAVPSQPDFIFDSFFSLKCTRPMPLFAVPGLVDHF